MLCEVEDVTGFGEETGEVVKDMCAGGMPGWKVRVGHIVTFLSSEILPQVFVDSAEKMLVLEVVFVWTYPVQDRLDKLLSCLKVSGEVIRRLQIVYA